VGVCSPDKDVGGDDIVVVHALDRVAPEDARAGRKGAEAGVVRPDRGGGGVKGARGERGGLPKAAVQERWGKFVFFVMVEGV
jgi:hypothetical protein